jgi:hypothetical protein
MTVGQLIQRLKKLNPDMPVVIKPRRLKGLHDDFVELLVSDIVELKTKELFTKPYWGEQVYDASETTHERNTKVLSLSGGTWFQRGSDEKAD